MSALLILSLVLNLIRRNSLNDIAINDGVPPANRSALNNGIDVITAVTQVRERLNDLNQVKVHLVDDVDTAFEMMRWLSLQETIAVDTETTGLDTHKDKVRLVQIGSRLEGWAIPWERWNGVFHDIIRRFRGIYIAHNAKFDVAMLDAAGACLPRDRIVDTRIMHHILYPTRSSALKSIATRLVDPRAAHAQKKLDEAISSRGGWTWADVPIDFEPYWSYGALDTVLTHRILDILGEEIYQQDAMKAFEIENTVQWSILKMEQRGVHIDVSYAKKYQQEFNDYCTHVEKWCRDEYGISPGSNKDVIRILNDEGVDFTKTTKGGSLSLDKEVLEGIEHPLAQAVLQRRQLQKLASTYLRHYIEEIDENNCIHPTINQLGTRTSRMSMQQPNFQNLPRRSESNKFAQIIRNCVNSRYDDGALFMCDFDQIEMRAIAHLSKDQGLINAFNGPDDFFITLARSIYNDNTITDKKDPRRQVTKNAGYAKIYGAGIPKFALTAGIPEQQARFVMQTFDKLFSKVPAFQKRIQHEAMRTRNETGDMGFVQCPLTGRIHHADIGKEYALVNYVTQGFAAQLFKMKIIELDYAGLDEFMILPVHDEIILDVPCNEQSNVVTTLNDIMNDDTIISVPVTAGISYGKRWGEKEDYVT